MGSVVKQYTLFMLVFGLYGSLGWIQSLNGRKHNKYFIPQNITLACWAYSTLEEWGGPSLY